MKLAARTILTTLFFFVQISDAALAGISVIGSSIHEREVNVGETYQGIIFIKNMGEKPAHVKVYQTDFKFLHNSKTNYDGSGKLEPSNASWISFGLLGLVIPPKGRAGINYTVKVPDVDSLSGTYRSMIVVEELSQSAPKASMPKKGQLLSAAKEGRRLGIKMVTHIVNSEIRDLPRKKFGGTVKGRVYDEETKEPIPNIILRINEATAITDKKGNFVFPSLNPGSYFFSVDQASIPLNKVTVQKNPMELTVTEGEETWVNVGITWAAALTGQIGVYHFDNNTLWDGKRENNLKYVYGYGERNNASRFLNIKEPKLLKAYGLAKVLVQLSNGSEIRRRVSDSSGHFVFKDLPHGKWTLTINEYYLPENHYFEKNAFEIDLRAKEEKEALIKILPMWRRILQDERISQAEDKEDTKKVVAKLGEEDLPNSPVVEDFQYYTVQKGDWLSKIAKKVYSDVMKYKEIFEANRKIIKDPNLIYPGQRLRIPHAKEECEYYVVQTGDWLSKIAKKVYGDVMKYMEIFEANRKIIKDPNLIYPGQRLRIPKYYFSTLINLRSVPNPFNSNLTSSITEDRINIPRPFSFYKF
ncbi:MAG: LysM peptidoglycan-binding domain-containing protein [bacterium]